jgi:phenylacetate-CoA ligase
MDAYGHLYKRVLFPAWEGLIRRRPTLPTLRSIEKTQWQPLDQLVAQQLRDVRSLVSHAIANVPHYKARFEEAGVDPHEIRTMKDLLRVPFLTREHAQTSSETRRSAVTHVDITKSTSGTLGIPVSFGYERASETWRQAVRLRSYGWAGYRPGMRTFHFWGPGARQTGWRKAKIELDHSFRRDMFFDCSVRSPERLDEAIARMKRFQPETIICFSTAGADLARRVIDVGARAHSIWGRTIPVICGAEALVPPDRQALEEAFGPEVFETYGSREVMLMGSECTRHNGLHIPMENVIVEVVVRGDDGDTSRHAAPGEVGEVVVTDLHNYAMPFIRYLNGDRAVAGDDARCSCGRELLRLRSIEGRVAATLRDASGSPVSGLFVHALLAHVGHAFRGFQAVQHADRSVTLRLVKSAAYEESAHRYLLEGFEKYLHGAAVKTEFLEEIPVGKNGKRQVILRED